MPDMTAIRQLVEDVGAGAALKLMDIFKSDVDTRVQAIRDYLENGGDVKVLRLNAHSLKGICRTYGAAAGGDAALALQEACDHGDEGTIRTTAQTALNIIPNDAEATISAARALAQN